MSNVERHEILDAKTCRYFYREVFYAAFGFGPYICFFCWKAVPFGGVTVHHIDEDQDHNHPYNLVPCHSRCHSIWHGQRRGFWPREHPETQRYVTSPEARAKLSAALKGKPKSAAHRRAMSEGAKRRWRREKAQGKRSPVG